MVGAAVVVGVAVVVVVAATVDGGAGPVETAPRSSRGKVVCTAACEARPPELKR